jgi:hypothetical protein
MGDQKIYVGDDGRHLFFRRADFGTVNAKNSLVLLDADGKIIIETDAFTSAQLCDLAHAFSRAYFYATGRVVWPVSGDMLHRYQKQQEEAEDARLAQLKVASPEAAADYEATITAARRDEAMKAAFADMVKRAGVAK